MCSLKLEEIVEEVLFYVWLDGAFDLVRALHTFAWKCRIDHQRSVI